jgi:hypothetical protein
MIRRRRLVRCRYSNSPQRRQANTSQRSNGMTPLSTVCRYTSGFVHVGQNTWGGGVSGVDVNVGRRRVFGCIAAFSVLNQVLTSFQYQICT